MLYPTMTPTRTAISLNGIWDFRPDGENRLSERWYEQPLQRTIPMPVPAPYNDIYEEPALRDHVGRVWYECELVVSASLLAERIVVRFGAVTHAAQVYLNGEPVVEHRGGFTPFEAEISALLRPGKNRLTAAVDNVLDYTTLPVGHYREEALPDGRRLISNAPNYDFFNYAGIHRPVWL